MMRDNTIWIVDDNVDHSELLTETILEVTRRYHIECKTNAEMALQDLTAIRTAWTSLPTAIFMDIKMPRINGIEALKCIKCDPLLSTIPIIMLSTSSNANEVTECLSAGAFMHVSKPLSRNDLANKIIPELENSN